MDKGNAIEVKDVYKGFKVYSDRGQTLKERFLFRKKNRTSYREILKGISFSVKKGEALALIGNNGCGKSTTLKLLTRIIYPNSGTVELSGRVVSLIELGAGFHPDMSGRENIYINASIFGLSKKDIDNRLDAIIKFSELEEYIDNPVRTYSSGMYMRLAFAIAINVDADILLVDEILAVGDAAFQAKCFNRMREIKGNGTTIVLVSHSMVQVEQLCDRSIWILEGKIRADGKCRDVDPMYLDYMAQKTIDESLAEDNTSTRADDDPNSTGQGRLEEQENNENQHELVEGVVEETKESTREQNGDINPPEEAKKRYGRGDIKIQEVHLKNENGKEVNTLTTEGGFSVEVRYKAKKTVRNASFGIGIFRNDGVGCYGTNTVIERFEKFDIDKDGEYRIVFPRTMLVQGSYWIDLAIECDGGIPIDYYKQAKRFDVISRVNDVDILRIPHRWESNLLMNGENML